MAEKIKVKGNKKNQRLINQIYVVENYTNNLKMVMENKSNPNDVNQMKTEKKENDKTKTTKNNDRKSVDEYQIIYRVK